MSFARNAALFLQELKETMSISKCRLSLVSIEIVGKRFTEVSAVKASKVKSATQAPSHLIYKARGTLMCGSLLTEAWTVRFKLWSWCVGVHNNNYSLQR